MIWKSFFLVFGVIFFGVCSVFSSSQVVVNSQDFRDVYLGGVYASNLNLSFNFFTNYSGNELGYFLDRRDSDLIYVNNLALSYGNFNFPSPFVVDSVFNSSVLLRNFELIDRGNYSKFFFVSSDNFFNAVSVIPFLKKYDIFPIFVDSSSDLIDVYNYLNVINNSKPVSVYYFDEFGSSFDFSTFDSSFDVVVFDDLGRFRNNYFILENLSFSGVNLSSLVFTDSNVLERGFFDRGLGLPIVYVPDNLEFNNSEFLGILSGFGVDDGYAVGGYGFDSNRFLIENLSYDIKFRFLEYVYNYWA